MSGLADSFTENDDAIKHLLRQVVYMFYPHQSIIIMEALLFHNVLFEDDLIKLCCMHKKVFRSFCNKLIDDKLIVPHIQKEETQPYKLFTRTYYYVHNIEAIDSIKWKIHTIVKKVKEEIGNFSEPQGYICPTCHTKYSLLDAASLLTDDKLNFECSICNDHLIDDDISQEQKKGQEKLEKLMSLVEPIIQYLKIVDDLKIDDNNFESTLMKYIPAFSDSLALYSVSNRITARRKKFDNNSAEINEANKKSQATIHVSITADDEDLKRERQKREDRNRKLRQNALPSWHQESTVGKIALGRLDSEDEEINNDSITQISNENNNNNNIIKHEDGLTDASTLIENIQVKSEDTIDSTTTSTSTTTTTTTAITNTIPTTNVNIDTKTNLTSSTVNQSLKSIGSTLTSTSAPTISNIPTISEGTTTEELDALSAYYSQLRQRQAIEEEEEEEEDEEDEQDIELGAGFGDDDDEEDIDMDAIDASNEETQSKSPEKQSSDENIQSSEIKQDSSIKEDIDEDDFDLDMFASDEE
jgi:transcription initiation factor TFIIE subunit alpha